VAEQNRAHHKSIASERQDKRLDFLVIGAQKSGTTAVDTYLREHPQLALPRDDKEAPFFYGGALDWGWDAFRARHFAAADPSSRWGKVTPQYMYEPSTTAPIIFGLLPHVRLVAILRNPIDRAVSHARMAVRRGVEQRPVLRAVLDALDPNEIVAVRSAPTETTAYLAWGEYGRLLQPYYEHFPRESIHITFQEDWRRSPEHELQLLYAHLGVDPNLLPANPHRRYHVGGDQTRLPNLEEIRSSWLGQYVWRRIPASGRTWLIPWLRKYEIWNTVQSPAAIPVEVRSRLAAHFAADVATLMALTGRKPPWTDWPND